MSLTVAADIDLHGIIRQITPELKERLSALGYQLTGITAKQRKKTNGVFFLQTN